MFETNPCDFCEDFGTDMCKSDGGCFKGKRIIEYKILPEYFDASSYNLKNFELREDDQNVQPGDIIRLMEYDGEKYTGRCFTRPVLYVLRDTPQYGLLSGYCIIGF